MRRLIRAFAAATCLSFAFFSCATPPSSGAPPDSPTDFSGKPDTVSGRKTLPTTDKDSAGTPLSVPSRDALKKNEFDANVLANLEIGTPKTLRAAVALINADTRGMTDRNRVALVVASELMKIMYPLESVSWPMPSVSDSDPYVGALKSARMGVYDYNTGNADFLSLVLPSLVLLTGNATTVGFEDDAAISLAKAASLNPRSALCLRLLALLSARRGDAAASEEYNRRAWALDDSCYPAGVDWSRALIRSGRPQDALEIASGLSGKYPSSADIRRLCAEAAFATRNWSLADGYVLDVLKVEPDNTAFVLMRARILIEQKDYLKANALLDAFATKNRTDRDYLLLRSRVVREWTKNLSAALSLLKEAQQRYPEDSEVLLASAEVCYQSGQSLNGLTGRDFVNAVLVSSPNNAVALALLAKDYIAAKEWPAAVKTGESLVAIDSSAENRALLVRAYLGSGSPNRALSVAKSLYAAGNASDDVTALYVETLIAVGEGVSASSIIAARLPSATPRLKSLLYYYQSKTVSDPDARLSSLRSSLLADPRNADSLFAMYEWYMGRKEYRMAQYYLKQVVALDPTNRKYADLQTSLNDLLAR